MTRQPRAIQILLATALLAWAARGSAAAVIPFPLHTEHGKRYLLTAQNQPFLIHGDSPWSLIARLSPEQAELYLESRRQQGFNAIMTNLIEHQYVDHPPRNAAGIAPFTVSGDFSTPNDAYFAHAEAIIASAAAKGMLVLLTPAYMGYQGGSEGWYQEMAANGVQKLHGYGRYIAQRFKDYDNIVWVHGGDFNPPEQALLRAIVDGIREVDTAGRWLHTFHGGRGTAAADFVGDNQQWLGINTVYTDEWTVVAKAQHQYAASPLPFFLVEARYENAGFDAHAVRVQAYQALLAGAMGQMMGNDPVWFFGAGWRTALASPAASTLRHLPTLFNRLDWWKLAPDTAAAVLISDPGSSDARAVAARAADGSEILVYTPVARTLVINLAQLTGAHCVARWYDPSSGQFQLIPGSPFANTGSKAFVTPAVNAGGDHDWLLLLQPQS
jgi:hypothetical protein